MLTGLCAEVSNELVQDWQSGREHMHNGHGHWAHKKLSVLAAGGRPLRAGHAECLNVSVFCRIRGLGVSILTQAMAIVLILYLAYLPPEGVHWWCLCWLLEFPPCLAGLAGLG